MLNQGNLAKRSVQHFFVLPQGYRSFPSVIPPASFCDLVNVECLLIIRPVVIDFTLLEVDVTLGGGSGIGEHYYSFREAKYLHGCSKALWFPFLVILKEMRTQGQKISFFLFWYK